MKASFLVEGYAREAVGAGYVFGESEREEEGVGRGRGYCTESEGRESLFNSLGVSELKLYGGAYFSAAQDFQVPQDFQRNRVWFLHSIRIGHLALVRHLCCL